MVIMKTIVFEVMAMATNGKSDNVVLAQCGVAYNWTWEGGAKHEGGVDGKGEHPLRQLSVV